MTDGRNERVAGPFIVWVDHGYNGWAPDSYATLEEAVAHESYGSSKTITRLVNWKPVEESEAKE